MLRLPPHFCRKIRNEKSCGFIIKTILFQIWNAYLRLRGLHLIAYSSHHIRFLNISRCSHCRKKAVELCISYCWPCTAYFHLVSTLHKILYSFPFRSTWNPLMQCSPSVIFNWNNYIQFINYTHMSIKHNYT